jgi:hypothetical protein
VGQKQCWQHSRQSCANSCEEDACLVSHQAQQCCVPIQIWRYSASACRPAVHFSSADSTGADHVHKYPFAMPADVQSGGAVILKPVPQQVVTGMLSHGCVMVQCYSFGLYCASKNFSCVRSRDCRVCKHLHHPDVTAAAFPGRLWCRQARGNINSSRSNVFCSCQQVSWCLWGIASCGY